MNNNDINNAIKIAGIIVPIITALIGLVTAAINKDISPADFQGLFGGSSLSSSPEAGDTTQGN